LPRPGRSRGTERAQDLGRGVSHSRLRKGAAVVARAFPRGLARGCRERTAALTKAAQAGRDLLADEQAAKAKAEGRITVGALIERYLNRMVRGQLRTAFEIEIRLKRTLGPLNDRYAEEVHRCDLRPILEKAAERGKLRKAEKQRQLMRALFRWAQSQDIIENDPTAGLASYGTSRRRDRVLAANEIKLLWDWTESCGMPPDYADALKLQLAIGARVGEVGGLARRRRDR
jgi:hypothetical protein